MMCQNDNANAKNKYGTSSEQCKLDGEQMVKFMAWANGIFTFNPTASLWIDGAHWIFRTHIFLGLTIFLVFPFTRLPHMLSVPVRYIWRGGYQIVRSRRSLING